MRMYAVKGLLGLALVVGVGGFIGTTPAGAIFPTLTMTSSPSSGPPGTAIAVSGLCNQDVPGSPFPPEYQGVGATQALVSLVVASTGVPVAYVTIPVGSNGQSWAGTFTVPLGTAGGQYYLDAECLTVTNQPSGDAPYTSNNFTVQGTLTATLDVTWTANPSQYSQAVAFTATATGPSGDPAPTGNSSFLFDGNYQAVTQESNGSYEGTVPQSLLTLGGHSLTWTYPGDYNYAPETSAFTQTVNETPINIAFVTPLASAPYGQTVTYSIKETYATPAAGLPTYPQAPLEITEGAGNAIGQGTPNAGTNVASVPISDLAPGPYELTASTQGIEFGPASANVGLSVTPTTSTTVSSSANPSPPGQSVTFVAQVKAVAPATGTPSGLVQLSIDGAPVGSAESLNSGVAIFPAVSTMAAGSHVISVRYSGSGATYSGSTGQLVETVQLAQPILNADPIYSSLPNLEAQLSYAGHAISGATLTFSTPSGSVICSGVTGTGGTATCPGAARAVLSLGYVVHFAGNASYLPGSASGSL